jgi:hypothetical protein
MLQAGRTLARFPMSSLIFFFNLLNLSSRTVAQMLIQLMTEMGTRDLPRGKVLLARKADNRHL